MAANTIYGTSDSEVIIDGSSKSTITLFISGSGSDTLYGGVGNDAYLISEPGDKLIYDNSGISTLLFADLKLKDVDIISYVKTSKKTSVLTVVVGSQTITVNDSMSTYVQFSDGFVLPVQKSFCNVDTVANPLFINGTKGADVLKGGIFTKYLYGDAGNDILIATNPSSGTDKQTLSGGAGNDILYGNNAALLSGDTGNDTYYVTNSSVSISELDTIYNTRGKVVFTSGIDSVITTAANYTLGTNIENLIYTQTSDFTGVGNADRNIITSGIGDDILDGKAGVDTLSGGAGNDTYIIDNSADIVNESYISGYNRKRKPIYSDAGGIDAVQSSASHKLSNYVENLTLSENVSAVSGLGNNLANIIKGNSFNNILDGGFGADTLVGGNGNDIYYIDNIDDVITELATADSGTDTVFSFINYTLADNVENLTLLGKTNLSCIGNHLSNVINGNTGSNTINGGNGDDNLYGGAGNDVYIIDSSASVTSGNDNISDYSGYNTVYFKNININEVQINYNHLTKVTTVKVVDSDQLITINGGTTNLLFKDGIVIDPKRQTNYQNNTDRGSYNIKTNNDVIYLQNDYVASTVIDGGAGNDILMGNSLTVSLIGGEGNDLLIATNPASQNISGGFGNDTLIGNGNATLFGNDGNDTYMISSADDVIDDSDTVYTDKKGRLITITGIDTVISSFSGSTTLVEKIENLTLIESAANGIGNSLNNVIIGNSNNNTLDGKAGIDLLVGGSGDDTYYVDNTSDVVNESKIIGYDKKKRAIFSDNGGIDSVFSSVNFALSNYVENLTISQNATIATGNDLDNTIVDNTSNSTYLSGGRGNDTYYINSLDDTINENIAIYNSKTKKTTFVDAGGIDTVVSSVDYSLSANLENLTINGSANRAVGNQSDNTITGNVINSTLIGGAGNDTYVLRAINDIIAENSDEGFDTVITTNGYSLSANLENLTATADNVTLSGNASNNKIHSIGSNNTLIGGAGDDIYIINSGNTSIIENAPEGNDTVRSFVTYTLGNNVENLILESQYNSTLNEVVYGEPDYWGENLDYAQGDNGLRAGLYNSKFLGVCGEVAVQNVLIMAGLLPEKNNYVYSPDFVDIQERDIVQYAIDNNLCSIDEASDGTQGSMVDSKIALMLTQKGLPATNQVVSLEQLGTYVSQGKAVIAAVDPYALYNINVKHTLNNHVVLVTGIEYDVIEPTKINYLYVCDSGYQDKTYSNFKLSYELFLNGFSPYISAAGVPDPGFIVVTDNPVRIFVNQIDAIGNSLDNTIIGNSGRNTLDGSTGSDTLIGGGGADTYIVDNINDFIVEDLYQGTDNVLSSVDYTLQYNVENLTLTSSNNINGFGNNLDNIIIGNSGNNLIEGLEGNDYLDGKGGSDTLFGGLGNDTYLIYSVADEVTETSTMFTEIDTVVLMTNFDYTLGQNVENLTLKGTLDGTTLMGNSLNNVITGGDGDDFLYGNEGSDTLIGGFGDDNYFVDNINDVIIEINGDYYRGDDTITTSVSMTIADGVENLILLGSDDLNAYANRYGCKFVGNSGKNLLLGSNTNDELIGGSGGYDTIYAYDGDDVIASDGNSYLDGGKGHDVFYATATDTIDGGVDTSLDVLYTTDSVSLVSGNIKNIDDVNYLWYAPWGVEFNVEGNSLNNYLRANGANNTIIGNAGNDDLYGYEGDDLYLFKDGDGKDYISDSSGNDIVRFTSTIDTSAILIYQRGSYKYFDYGDIAGQHQIEYNTSSEIERIELSDGRYLTSSDVNNIISSVAAFDTANGSINLSDGLNNDEKTLLLAQNLVSGWST